jgi:hypothetical protein
MATRSNYALRLPSSLKKEAEKLAASEGTTLNQLINMAVAEKVSALRTATYLRERSARANVPRALEILRRAGKEGPVAKGDEVS